jgi:hypothetical protein
MINYANTDEIRVNNKIERPITIENREIKRVTDFCYFGITVSENGGAIFIIKHGTQICDCNRCNELHKNLEKMKALKTH